VKKKKKTKKKGEKLAGITLVSTISKKKSKKDIFLKLIICYGAS